VAQLLSLFEAETDSERADYYKSWTSQVGGYRLSAAAAEKEQQEDVEDGEEPQPPPRPDLTQVQLGTLSR
jgi:hypothetical protein